MRRLCYRDGVKTLRIWLVVLFAVLLPVRGAVAAAMLCPITAPASTTASNAQHAAMGHTLPGAMPDHAHLPHGQTDTQPASAGDECNLCCDFCSVTPLASSLPTLPTAQEHATLSFPDLGAPAPSFLSDGQERPPRST